MFQGYSQNIKLQAPFLGIDSTVDNDPRFARYMQNMVVSDNNTCELRFGTDLVAKFSFDALRLFRSTLAVMSYLAEDGTSKKIVYQNYLTALSDTDGKVTQASATRNGYSTITIDISGLTDVIKANLKKVLFNGVYVYISQSDPPEGKFSDGADIDNVIFSDTTKITFDIPFLSDFFATTFSLWVERAGLYLLKDDNTFTKLVDDLDPNVIVSSLNYQGNLLICNGVDPVQVYDGSNITTLNGKASIPIINSKDIKVDTGAKTITFNIYGTVKPELMLYIQAATILSLASSTMLTVVSINFTNATDPNTQTVTITVIETPPATIDKIFYTKTCPPFSFMVAYKKRLWALAGGRPQLKQFRPSIDAMRVYYNTNLESIDGWFDNNTNQVRSINLSSNTDIPDNLETIIPYNGKILFVGRETIQIYDGEDPDALLKDKSTSLEPFQIYTVLPVGILQRTLYADTPDGLMFISKYGLMGISNINQYQQFDMKFKFSAGIDQYLKNQLSLISTDREYRSFTSFLYPYARFIGFKLKYSCLIYQIKKDGNWTIFDQNFALAKSFLYDAVSQNLFLGMDKGSLLVYTDKIPNQAYQEWNTAGLLWQIHYNWIYPGQTWNNSAVMLACRTLNPITVGVEVFADYNDADSVKEDISIDQAGGLYNIAKFGEISYAYRNGAFPYENMKFSGDALMIAIGGVATNQLIFDKLFLNGGVTSGS